MNKYDQLEATGCFFIIDAELPCPDAAPGFWAPGVAPLTLSGAAVAAIAPYVADKQSIRQNPDGTVLAVSNSNRNAVNSFDPKTRNAAFQCLEHEPPESAPGFLSVFHHVPNADQTFTLASSEIRFSAFELFYPTPIFRNERTSEASRRCIIIAHISQDFMATHGNDLERFASLLEDGVRHTNERRQFLKTVDDYFAAHLGGQQANRETHYQCYPVTTALSLNPEKNADDMLLARKIATTTGQKDKNNKDEAPQRVQRARADNLKLSDSWGAQILNRGAAFFSAGESTHEYSAQIFYVSVIYSRIFAVMFLAEILYRETADKIEDEILETSAESANYTSLLQNVLALDSEFDALNNVVSTFTNTRNRTHKAIASELFDSLALGNTKEHLDSRLEKLKEKIAITGEIDRAQAQERTERFRFYLSTVLAVLGLPITVYAFSGAWQMSATYTILIIADVLLVGTLAYIIMQKRKKQ